MLQTYREECLPLYKEGWETFNDASKAKLIDMNNFLLWLTPVGVYGRVDIGIIQRRPHCWCPYRMRDEFGRGHDHYKEQTVNKAV